MLVRNPDDVRDALALALVKEHGLTLRNLQMALEWSAEAELPLDVVLRNMEVLSKEKIAAAAKATGFVLTAEQMAVPRAPAQGTRAFSRHTFHLDVGFEDWEGLELTYANNISRGGIGVTMPLTSEAPEMGKTITLALTLPDGRSVPFQGKIAYVRDGSAHRHVGIELFPNTEDLLIIDRLLRANAPQE
jgi:hypothetical protein